MNHILSILFGFLLDLLLADPSWMPHPVIYMGKAISYLEKALRKAFPKTEAGERAAGKVLAAVLPIGTLILTAAVCRGASLLHPMLGLAVETIWCWQALALRGLASEAKAVYEKLAAEDLPAARTQVARIVGRDTQELTAEGVTKAAVETVAENFSDGVAAPLFYMLLGGAPLALCYKAINTMDSMVGYKNERYLHFGRASAKLDDLANFIPARLAAMIFLAAAGLTGQNVKNAWKIWRRDRFNHASPNSAQTESVCAGALGIQLAGPAYYFGQRHEKPTIGNALRPVQPEDILRANKMLYGAGIMMLVLGLAICMVIL